MSVLLSRLYSTEVLNSVCHENFGVRGKFVRQAVFWVTSAADNSSIFYFAYAKFVTRFASNWKSSRLSSILREFRGNQTCEQLTCSSFVLFFCFSPSGFKYFRTLVANIRSTNFLGSSLFWKVYAPNCSTEVLSSLRGAHFAEKAVYSSNTLMLKRFFKHELNRLNAFVITSTDALMLMYQKPGKCSKTFHGA